MNDETTRAIGIDVGGTKCAGGVVVLPKGQVVTRRVQPTSPGRGGQAVLTDVIDLARSLQNEATRHGFKPTSIGIGVAELVDATGRVVSEATIGWKGIPVEDLVRAAISLPVRVDADVRAAARAEARLGAGRGFNCFLYVTVGTGISSALVVDGCPHIGARGLTGTFASSPGLVPGTSGELIVGPPLEQFAAGPALVARLAGKCRDFNGGAPDVMALAEGGDEPAQAIVESAGRALGAAIAHLVNILDPAAIVIGGGLGLAGGLYWECLSLAVREFIYSDVHRHLPLLRAQLGNDSGWIGAALAAVP